MARYVLIKCLYPDHMADGFRLYNTSLTSHGRREGGVDSENLFRFIFVINRNRSLLELVARIRTDANYKLYERPVDNTGASGNLGNSDLALLFGPSKK